jgi:NAD-dependent dihydropyrimidine dehydrogenase PreA subunit
MTSSELFCKTFDPYFATVNIFNNTDIVLFYAIPAFIITVGGALLFRLFWCKYLCPLGAMSNIFMNLAGAGGVTIIYLAANYFGAGLSFVWLLGGLVLVGLINELGFMKSFFLPLPKITKSESCSNCGLCDSKCPQGIKISTMPVVNHIDCNLCTDCVHTCPKANVLTINKKKSLKHLAPVMVIVLIALSLGLASFFEFTTISLKWGKPSGEGAVYVQAGLKSIKCFGSSMALAGTLESIEGIYGLDTYAKTNKVKIYYDPSVISEKKVKESLFTPVKIEITEPTGNAADSVGVFNLGIFGLFDMIDFDNLYYVLSEKGGVYGFETHFGEPVKAVMYYNPSVVTPSEIRKRIENEYVIVKKETGDEKIKLNFKAENDGVAKEKITIPEYKKRIFISFEEQFNDYENYKPEQLSVFKFPFPEAADSKLKSSFVYLASHLSGNEGIVRFATGFSEGACGFIYFDASKTNIEKIKSSLTLKKFNIFISETETEEMDNPFNIKPDGKVFKANEIDE